RIRTGWFAHAAIPAYCIGLTIHFSEEEQYLIRHTGIGRNIFFRAPIPPDITDPETIKKLKTQDFGLFLIGDLLGFGTKTLLGVWPDLIGADEAEFTSQAREILIFHPSSRSANNIQIYYLNWLLFLNHNRGQGYI